MTTTYYKWLTSNLRGSYGHGDYTDYLPRGSRPGEWLPAVEDPWPCKRGYHVVDVGHLSKHWGVPGELYEVETRGNVVRQDDKAACEQIRLVHHIGTLTPELCVVFAADCAERVLPIFEAKYPADDRPRKAIEAALAWAKDPSVVNQDAVWFAADDAKHAKDAAWAAAEPAAGAAAGAARDVAWAAYAVEAAVGAAEAAAWFAAWTAKAARDAAWAIAWAACAGAENADDAAAAAECEWQGRHLIGDLLAVQS